MPLFYHMERLHAPHNVRMSRMWDPLPPFLTLYQGIILTFGEQMSLCKNRQMVSLL